MAKNLLIGLAIVIVVLVGGYYLLRQPAATENGQTASSTTPGAATPPPGSPAPSPNPPPEAAAPSVRTDANAVPSNSTAVVTGSVTPNGALTTYWYEYGESTALGTRTSAQGIGSGFLAISAPAYITGLKATTTYYFRLSAQNKFGTVNGSMQSFSTNNNPPPAGKAPTAHTAAATSVERTTAMLNGQVNPNGASTTYWFEYGDSSDLGSVTTFTAGGDGTSILSVHASLGNLKPTTKYYFRVNAQNQFGTVNGSIFTFTTVGPPAPAAPAADTTSATSIGTSTVTMNARINPNGADTTYSFEYSKDSLLGSIIGNVTPVATVSGDYVTVSVKADATDLAPNTRYFYRVVAKNQYGTIRGDIVAFRTK